MELANGFLLLPPTFDEPFLLCPLLGYLLGRLNCSIPVMCILKWLWLLKRFWPLLAAPFDWLVPELVD